MLVIQGYDPRTGEPVGEPVPETSDASVDAIVSSAASAAAAWAATPGAVRASALTAVAAALDQRCDELAALADAETALGIQRLTGEVARTTGQLRLFADVLRDAGYLDVAATPADGGDRRS
jgi:NADP-dependent aldehyde dehydrogenase